MTRSEILDTAKRHVTKDRNSSYGEPEDSFGLIANLWSVYRGEPFSSYDVAMMMALMKIARAKANPSHLDSAVDACGYLACGGEIAASQSTEKPPEEAGIRLGPFIIRDEQDAPALSSVAGNGLLWEAVE